MTDDKCCTNNIDYERTFSRLPFNRRERGCPFIFSVVGPIDDVTGEHRAPTLECMFFCILGKGNRRR